MPIVHKTIISQTLKIFTDKKIIRYAAILRYYKFFLIGTLEFKRLLNHFLSLVFCGMLKNTKPVKPPTESFTGSQKPV